METFIAIVIIILLIIFNRPLFALASGLLGLYVGGVLLFVVFVILKALLFGS